MAPTDWLRRLLLLLEAGYDGTGGAISNANGQSLLGWAGYSCEFRESLPRGEARDVANLTLGNAAYRRDRFLAVNVDRFREIHDELEALAPDSFITEIAEERAELLTIGTGITPPLEKYADAVDYLAARLPPRVLRARDADPGRAAAGDPLPGRAHLLPQQALGQAMRVLRRARPFWALREEASARAPPRTPAEEQCLQLSPHHA